MKLIYFYLSILLPFLVILLIKNHLLFFVLILLYAIIYRPIINYFKLKYLKLITGKHFCKLFIPFWEVRFFKELVFKIQ